MRFRFLTASAVTLACLSLAACSTFDHKKPGEGPEVFNANQQGEGATPAGYQSNSNAEAYGEQTSNYQSQGNPLCRPASIAPGKNQRYFFAFNKYDVKSDYNASLQTEANYLANHPYVTVTLQGNTDDIGSIGYNMILGRKRALAVQQVLEKFGALPTQMKIVSYGPTRPVALGQSSTARACNRRVNLVFGTAKNDAAN